MDTNENSIVVVVVVYCAALLKRGGYIYHLLLFSLQPASHGNEDKSCGN